MKRSASRSDWYGCWMSSAVRTTKSATPTADRTAYVTAVYEAAIIDGSPAVSDDELSDVAWFAPAQLPGLELSRFTRALLLATGYL